MSTSFLNQLDWRFATKQFDPAQKVTSEELSQILTAVRMAPTSFGLQPFHVIVVTDPAVRTTMREASFGQPQVTDASHVLVFAARTDIVPRIEALLDLMSGGDTAAREGLAGYGDMMHGMLDPLPEDAARAWAARQAYIAMGFGLAACAELGVDSCAMEGFDREAVTRLLDLPAHMQAVCYLAIGHRAAGPQYSKVRFPQDDLFSTK